MNFFVSALSTAAEDVGEVQSPENETSESLPLLNQSKYENNKNSQLFGRKAQLWRSCENKIRCEQLQLTYEWWNEFKSAGIDKSALLRTGTLCFLLFTIKGRTTAVFYHRAVLEKLMIKQFAEFPAASLAHLLNLLYLTSLCFLPGGATNQFYLPVALLNDCLFIAWRSLQINSILFLFFNS